MKELERLITSDEAQYLMNEIREICKTLECNCYCIEEIPVKQQKKKAMLKRLKEIMKGEGED